MTKYLIILSMNVAKVSMKSTQELEALYGTKIRFADKDKLSTWVPTGEQYTMIIDPDSKQLARIYNHFDIILVISHKLGTPRLKSFYNKYYTYVKIVDVLYLWEELRDRIQADSNKWITRMKLDARLGEVRSKQQTKLLLVPNYISVNQTAKSILNTRDIIDIDTFKAMYINDSNSDFRNLITQIGKLEMDRQIYNYSVPKYIIFTIRSIDEFLSLFKHREEFNKFNIDIGTCDFSESDQQFDDLTLQYDIPRIADKAEVIIW